MSHSAQSRGYNCISLSVVLLQWGQNVFCLFVFPVPIAGGLLPIVLEQRPHLGRLGSNQGLPLKCLKPVAEFALLLHSFVDQLSILEGVHFLPDTVYITQKIPIEPLELFVQLWCSKRNLKTCLPEPQSHGQTHFFYLQRIEKRCVCVCARSCVFSYPPVSESDRDSRLSQGQ